MLNYDVLAEFRAKVAKNVETKYAHVCNNSQEL